jgi:hypothetical protein
VEPASRLRHARNFLGRDFDLGVHRASPMSLPHRLALLFSPLAFALSVSAAPAQKAAAPKPAPLPGDRMIADYFRQETARVNAGTFASINSGDDWTRERPRLVAQLQEMLGLSPWPERTDLKAVVSARIDHADFVVEKLHYQALPGLYVGANLYVPKNLKGKVPAILYVCGHSQQKVNGVAYGAKASYHHHGVWFARNGYVCLLIDTIQLGELEGVHHGTSRFGMWWWNARGYTPAGVEAWNSIRALDYLQSRPEVDGEKLGMTGRSGGGAYTWFAAALDERVKVAVPVAGITDLHNHVIDGTVAGHCDCMFIVNTYRWDYAKLAALVAPRPLLLANSDKDTIFPLEGVFRTHREVAKIYQLLGAADKLGLLITEGPHKDTQELQVPTFRWFNRFLKGDESPVEMAAAKMFTPQQLKVFTGLPADERTTKIHDTFVAAAAPRVPLNDAEWREQRGTWLTALREKTFAGWPAKSDPPRAVRVSQHAHDGLTLTRWEFASQDPIALPLFVVSRGGSADVRRVMLRVLDEQSWAEFVAAFGAQFPAQVGSTGAGASAARARPSESLRALQAEVVRGEVAVAFLPPRGVGPTQWTSDEKDRIQIRRRLMLLGQTLDGMQVWDIKRAIETLRQPQLFGAKPVELTGERRQAVNALYASLFTEGVASLELIAPPASHMTGPDYLNVLRFLDVPQAAALAAEGRPITFRDVTPEAWSWTQNAAKQLNWPAERLRW